jgi:isopenicillin N synthase-like dioxygenase
VSVPILDIGGLRHPDDPGFAAAAAAVGAACEDPGFFAVSNHGIEQELCDQVLSWLPKLFGLPAATKLESVWTDDRPNRGYDPPGRQRLDDAAAPDIKEAWSLGPEHLSGSAGSMQAANRWPDLDGFRSPIETFHLQAMDLCARLLQGIAVSLGLEPGYFAPFHRRPVCTLRLLHYPARPAEAADDQLGCGAHTDWGAITVLLQDSAGSLEVQTADGEWLGVPSTPGTLVVNVGDLLARWTNDQFRSTPHRVLGVPNRSRYSAACFFDLDEDAVIECIPTCTSTDNPPRYPAVTAGGHLRARFEASLR